MITKEEWDNLKDAERYGMMVEIFKRLDFYESRLQALEMHTKCY